MRRVRVDFAREARVFAGYLQDIPPTNTKYHNRVLSQRRLDG